MSAAPEDSDFGMVQPLITSRTVGLLLLGSTAWVTLCLIIWLVPPVFAGASFAFYTVFWIGLGPPFGALAAGAMVVAMLILRRALPSPAVVVAAAILGWTIALGAWRLVGASTFDATGTALAVGVALIGATISTVVVWPRRAQQASTT